MARLSHGGGTITVRVYKCTAHEIAIRMGEVENVTHRLMLGPSHVNEVPIIISRMSGITAIQTSYSLPSS